MAIDIVPSKAYLMKRRGETPKYLRPFPREKRAKTAGSLDRDAFERDLPGMSDSSIQEVMQDAKMPLWARGLAAAEREFRSQPKKSHQGSSTASISS